jgi:hypothetical protein
MKGLSTSIVIVVTAVVILVAALVILTIFGGGMGSVGTLTNFRTQCIAQCQVTCPLGSLPPTWTMTVKIQGTDQSCATATGVSGTCGGECGAAPATGGGGATQQTGCCEYAAACVPNVLSTSCTAAGATFRQGNYYCSGNKCVSR